MIRTGRPGPASTVRAELLAGYAFLTAVVAAGGVVLAGVVLLVDGAAGEAGVLAGMAISPAAARTILGTIAGSLITIASLTASLTIVTLQLLSSQYTPRTVRGFLRRKVSQVVSGAFVGTFLYCLVLLLFVRQPGDENDPFVPSLGVVLSVVLAAGGLLMLVLFIHALARMIQISTMTSGIAEETVAVVRARAARPEAAAIPDLAAAAEVRAAGVGYVRSTVPEIALERLPAGAAGTLVLRARPGDFVTAETVVAAWLPASDGAPGEAVAEAARAAVLLGLERDLDDDPAFGVRQIADIALRALSAGINDPSTAVACIGYLRQVFEELAACPLRPLDAERDGLRVVTTEVPFDGYVDLLAEVGAYCGDDFRVGEALAAAELSAAAVARRHGHEDRAVRLEEEARAVTAAMRPLAKTDRAQERLRRLA